MHVICSNKMTKSTTLLLLSAVYFSSVRSSLPTNLRKLGSNNGFLFTMTDCPGKCLSYGDDSDVDTDNNNDNENKINDDDLFEERRIKLANCSDAGENKFWEKIDFCGGEQSFFQLRHVNYDKCVSDPPDCSACHKSEIDLVDCDSNQAAWFSYGNLHKTSPQAYYLYSARCWLNDGIVSVLATPSLDAKACPQNHAEGACQRIEWNTDRFSKDVLYYEWSFNSVKSECDADLYSSSAEK